MVYRNIKAEQARKGMTNQQVADYLGISRAGYESKLRTGKFFVHECLKLCTLFGVEFSYLFAGKCGESFNENRPA